MSKSIKVPSEIYSRVSGYYRPVNQWNKGKQEEYACRTCINISDEIMAHASQKELQASIS